MNRLITKVFIGVGILAAAVALYFVSPLITNQVHAENGRIVTIYHDGQQQVVATQATTVGEALERAGVRLQDQDAAEPSKDTKLVAQNYDVNVYRARPVTVVDGNQRYRIMSPYQSAKDIAKAAGLQVYDEDILTISRIDDFVAEGGAGLMLKIDRSTPLKLILYGKLVDARTQASTIGDLLKEKSITLEASDGVSPGSSTPITTNMTVDVYRNGEQTISEEKAIDFTIKKVQDADHEVGYKNIQTAGVKGKKIVTYQIELKNGKEVSRKEIQSVVTTQPKEQVEVVGTKTVGFNGNFGDALAKLRSCEAGGNYSRNSGNGYYGAYQYDISTWANYGGYARPDQAPAAVQDQKAYETYKRRGWQPWPGCSRGLRLQDIYR
jgi:resuscitation-promoting factor RpfB